MEENILKQIFFKDNFITLEGVRNDSTLIIYNKSSKFQEELQDGVLNIANFIQKNEICLQENTELFVAIKNEEDYNNLYLHKLNTGNTVHQNIEVKTIKYTYIINITTSEKDELKLKIKRILTDIPRTRLTNLHINNKHLNLTIEKVGARFIDEIGILLSNTNGLVKGITCSDSNRNKALFSINLEEISTEQNTIFSSNLVLDGHILALKSDEAFNLTKEYFITEHGLSIVSVETDDDNNLTLHVTNNICIKPKLISSNYINNTLCIKGKLNSDIDYQQVEGYNTYLKLVSKDGTKSILEEISIDNGRFTTEINDESLLQIKDVASEPWKLYISVHRDDEEITAAEIECDKDFSSVAETISNNNNSASMTIYSSDNSNLQLHVKGPITIEQILSIQRLGNKLIVRFRTKENIEKLLKKNKLITNIETEIETLECKKIKKRGKKTYRCVYKTNDSNAILDLILEKGLTIISTVNGVTTSQTIQEINEMAVYRTILEGVRNTRKYKTLLSKIYTKIFLKLPVNKKKVLFESFLGRNISGNPKYIYEYMATHGLSDEYKLIWILNNLDEEIEGKHKKVKRKSLKYYYHMATSGYWIFNARQADEIIKRPETKYLQTWHGTPLKRLASDMTNVDMGGNKDINKYKLNFFKNTRRWDYLLAQNDYSEEIFKRAFNFDKTFIKGYPANDILYTKNNTAEINKIKDKLGIPKKKKVILYAPTWRDDNFYKKGQYKLDLKLELDKMQQELGDEYIILIRAHYLIANSINITNYKGFVYDFSKGYDIQELYLVSDVLITDYSSVMFDYANLKRPMIFFMYDLEKYRDSLRGFYFDFEETAPGPIVKTTDGVIKHLRNLEELNKEYQEKQDNFYSKFCHVDNGKSAKTVVNKLFLNQ